MKNVPPVLRGECQTASLLTKRGMKILPSLLAIAIFSIGIAFSAPEFSTFVSKQAKFSVEYPSSWKPFESKFRKEITPLHLVSEDGLDFVLSVIPGLDSDVTPEESVKYILTHIDSIIEKMRMDHPDAKLVDCGETILSNQPAAWYVFDFTISKLLPIRGICVETSFDGKAYTLTFKCLRQDYDAGFEIRRAVLLSFQLEKNPNVQKFMRE